MRTLLCEVRVVRVLVVVGLLSMLSGCISKNESEGKDKVDPSNPAVPTRPLSGSFACLSAGPDSSLDVRWDVALTLAEISAAVYDDPPDEERKLKALGALTVTPFTRGSSEGLVASDDRAVVIAFRGTKGFADMLTDIKIFGHPVDGGRIHQGFFSSVEAVYNDAIEAGTAQDAKRKFVWVTGHSLGGAMAAAYTFKSVKEKGIRPNGIYTYGQPLVMTESLCQFMLDEFGDNYVRFVNNGDPISRVLRPYRHAGARVFFKDGKYACRVPMIAVSAGPDTPSGARPSRFADENEGELQLMTDEEFIEFERQVQAAKSRPAPAARSNGEMVVGAWYDPFTHHYMAEYLENIRTIGQPLWK